MAEVRPSEETSDSAKSVKYTNNDHGDTLRKAFYQAWENKEYCDITLTVGKDSIQAHRLVLASLSEYFKVLFNMDINGKSDEAEIHEVEFESLCDIVHYAYTGNIEISVDNVSALLIASSYLQVAFVKQSCEKFLLGSIDKMNCICMWRLADQYSVTTVVQKAMQILAREFDYVSQTDDFVTLMSVEMLRDWLQQDGLVISRDGIILPAAEQEVCVFSGILRYIEETKITMMDYLPLLKHIRLPLIEETVLREHLSLYPILCEQESVKTLLSTVKAAREINVGAEIYGNWLLPRKPKVKGYVYNDMKYGDGGNPGTHFFLAGSYGLPSPDMNARITSIDVHLRHWSGDTVVVGGMLLKYSDNTEVQSGLKANSPHCTKVESLAVADTEYITKVIFHSGWMVDNVKFETNLGKTYGPWGGNGGGERICVTPKDAVGFVHSFAGLDIESGNCRAIHHVRVGWATVDDIGEETINLYEGIEKDDVSGHGNVDFYDEDYDYEIDLTDEEYDQEYYHDYFHDDHSYSGSDVE